MNRPVLIRNLAVILLVGLGFVLAEVNLSCCRTDACRYAKGDRVPSKTIEQVLQENTDQWMAIPGVVGTAIGMSKGKPCIRIFTSSNPSGLKDKIPSTVQGYPIFIEHTGEIRALDSQ